MTLQTLSRGTARGTVARPQAFYRWQFCGRVHQRREVIEGNWKQFKGHVKEKWGKLTDDNLDTIAGKRDQLAGSVQEAYGITKDQAELQVKAFEEIHKDYQPKISA